MGYVVYSKSVTSQANVSEEIPPATPVPVVAFLTISISLRELVQDLLPATSTGLLVVMSQDCLTGQFFTYSVDGSDSTFLRAGDLHDTDFDYLEYQTTFDQLMRVDGEESNMNNGYDSDRESHYTDPPVAGVFCPCTLKI